MSDVEVIDAETSTELEPYEPGGPTTLYGSSDPRVVLERMHELADALMDVVRSQKLAVTIRGREHLQVEAWTTLGALVGVHAAIVWTRPNESGDGIVARAEARTLAGALVGAAEGECSRVESRWKTAEPYAVRSMASTRAISRALQAPLRHIAVLAGYEGAAAEEMPPDEAEPTSPADPVAASPYQLERIRTSIRTLQGADPEIDWKARAKDLAGVPAEMLTKTGAEMLIEKLQAELAALVDREDE
jgi:hypothetical protein